MSVERSHQTDERPMNLSRMPRIMVAKAAPLETNTTATAIQPRFTHPNTMTGVKYKATIRTGAIAGIPTCRTTGRMRRVVQKARQPALSNRVRRQTYVEPILPVAE